MGYNRLKIFQLSSNYDSDKEYESDGCLIKQVAGCSEYLILTKKEANKEAALKIKEYLWAFNYEFISNYFKVEINKHTYNKLRELYEDANEILLILIGNNIKKLIQDAISYNGRGHFISYYDGQEEEVSYNGKYFYIYRLN